jgi:RHS repeat-associated protein
MQNGVPVRYYTLGGNTLGVRQGASVSWLYGDHLGSTSASSGAAATSERYYAYGKDRGTGNLPTDHRFTGQISDASGLVFMNARYYDPVLGSFISPDTVVPEPGQPEGYNRYAYANGNPLAYSDPNGHCAMLASGEPDRENDAECWMLADSIYLLGQNGLVSGFAYDWHISPEDWQADISSQSFATSDYLRPFAERYHIEWARAAGLPIDPVVWNPVVNPSISDMMPGHEIVEDVELCRGSWRDCGRALDDLSVSASSVAVGCAAAFNGPCSALAAGASTALSAAGTVLTGVSVFQQYLSGNLGKDDGADLVVSIATTTVGAIWGGRPGKSQVVGLTGSVVQWLWDHWE